MPAIQLHPRSSALLLCATLAACGGGGDEPAADSAPPPLPTGLFGKVTGTHAGVLVSGTYTLANCRNSETQAAVSRKLRLGADGSMHWLDAAASDAALLQLVPSNTEHQNRQVSMQRSGSADTANSYTVSFERIVYAPSFTRDGFVQINGTGPQLRDVQVRYRPAGAGAEVAEQCNDAATVPQRFSTAIAHEKLASLVALNGGTLAAAPYSYFGAPYLSVAIAADGSVTTQAANAPSTTPWGSGWVEAFVFDSGFYSEYFNTTSDSGAGSPTNAHVEMTIQHPTLLVPYPNVGPIGQPIGLQRNTGGSGPTVQFYEGGG
jgi:hypothetical protein